MTNHDAYRPSEIAIDKERLLSTFLELLRIDSPSGQEGEVIRDLDTRLKELGLETRIDQAGNLIGRRAGRGEPLILCAHVDHVVPCIGIQPQVKDGIIRSDGSTILGSDDTSGVAIILEVLHLLRDVDDPPPLEVVFTVHEEKGLLGSKGLDYALLQARSAIVLDMGGPMGWITVQGPSQNKLVVTVHGRKAHAACAPEEGVNAIRVAAEAISAMPLGRVDEETTANIGVIHGGEATNIVPDRVEMLGEARSLSDEKLQQQTQAMVDKLNEAAARHGATADIDVNLSYRAFKVPEDAPIIRRLTEAMRSLAVEPTLISTVGGSDSNVLNEHGIHAVNISTGMQQVHTTDEHIALDDMVDCTRVLMRALGI